MSYTSAIVSLLIACCAIHANAGVIGADTLVVGQWDIQLSGGNPISGWDCSRLFPAVEEHHGIIGGGRNTDDRNQKKGNDRLTSSRGPSARRRLFGPSRLSCSLSVFKDGTFTLSPKDATKSNCMPIRGRWQVLANPYCITDRFYDQLLLESYPRMEKQKKEHWHDPRDEILRTVQLQLHCRLWGRHNEGGILHKLFSSTAERDNYSRARLTHGTLMWTDRNQGELASTKQQRGQKQGNNSGRKQFALPSFSFRPIAASFSGRQRPLCQQPTTINDWNEDEEIFGY